MVVIVAPAVSGVNGVALRSEPGITPKRTPAMTTPHAPIDFDELPWVVPLPGARFKVHREGTKQIRLVEFTDTFVEPHWCEKGHAGYVLEGTLEIDFHGRVVHYPEGSGLFIPGGTASAHKARAVTPVARLILVEDIPRDAD